MFTKTIVVLGKNWSRNKNTSSHPQNLLSMSSMLSAIAASIVIQKETEPLLVIFSGGFTGGKEIKMSESEAMLEFLKDHGFKTPKNVTIICEEKSYSTYSNAREVRNVLKEEGTSHIDILITVKPHVRRALLDFRDGDVVVKEACASEDIIRSTNHAFEEVLKDYRSTPDYNLIQKEEKVLRVGYLLGGRVLIDRIARRRLSHSDILLKI